MDLKTRVKETLLERVNERLITEGVSMHSLRSELYVKAYRRVNDAEYYPGMEEWQYGKVKNWFLKQQERRKKPPNWGLWCWVQYADVRFEESEESNPELIQRFIIDWTRSAWQWRDDAQKLHRGAASWKGKLESLTRLPKDSYLIEAAQQMQKVMANDPALKAKLTWHEGLPLA